MIKTRLEIHKCHGGNIQFDILVCMNACYDHIYKHAFTKKVVRVHKLY